MLNNLSPIVKKRKRIGRGGSRGGSSGRGHKGQKARSGGGVHPRFEGGQMPLVRRLPKRGFSNADFKQVYQIINLKELDDKFKDGEVINKDLLIEKKIVKNKKSVKIKILGKGQLSKKLIVHADAISQTAQQAILDKGGQVVLTTKEI